MTGDEEGLGESGGGGGCREGLPDAGRRGLPVVGDNT